MRIATRSAFEASINQLQQRHQTLVRTHEQMTSGKRVLRASDDPAAAAQAERARAQAALTESRQRALGASLNAMTLTEKSLGDASEMLHQARELMISAGNGAYGPEERRHLARTLDSLRTDLLAVANRADGTGRYLFGGPGSSGLPLQDVDGSVVSYHPGVPGRQSAASGESLPLTSDGAEVWLAVADPQNPGSTVSIFETLARVRDELQQDPLPPTTVSQGLREIDLVMDHLSGWRADAGVALRRIEALDARLAQSGVDAARELSEAEDLDMAAAISDFQRQQTGYDAALKTYSIVQRMSLFDYIR